MRLTVCVALGVLLGGATGCVSRARGLQPLPEHDPMRAVQAQRMVDQGMALAQAGDLVRAEQYLAEGLERGADPRRVLPTLLRVCVTASRFRAAVTYAAQYLERHPADWALRFLVGTIHEELGEHFTARRHFEAVLSVREAHAGAHFMLGKILRDTYTNASAADVHFRRYLELDPQGVFADEARGSILRTVVPTVEGELVRPPVLRAVEATPDPPASAAHTATPLVPVTAGSAASPQAPTALPSALPTAPSPTPPPAAAPAPRRPPPSSPPPRQVPR